MASMGRRSGKSQPKKGTSKNTIKRFLAAEPEDPTEADCLDHSPCESGVSSTSHHRPEARCRSSVSSGGSDEEGSPIRHSGVAELMSGLPTKSYLASMLLILEKVIK